jgi:hypothetical protein
MTDTDAVDSALQELFGRLLAAHEQLHELSVRARDREHHEQHRNLAAKSDGVQLAMTYVGDALRALPARRKE